MSRRFWTSVAVLFGYCAVSFFYFGVPFVWHPGRLLVGMGGGSSGSHDPEIFVWSFAWWPHAIGAWSNPFFTHVIYAPTGINIAWTASAPGLALAFSPLTVLVGPAASYNVAAMLLFAVAAWTCFLLCRALTGSVWASVVGGYLFGFSSYMIGHQSAGHLNLTGVFLVPLVALAVLRFVQGELSGWALAWRVGVLIAFQISISTEITLTLTVMLGLGLLLAFAFLRYARPRLRSAVAPLVGGYVLGALIAAPFVYYTLTGLSSHRFADAPFFSGDLLNLVIPTQLTGWGGSWLASVSVNFPGNINERGSYLGIPVLIMVGWYAIRSWRSPGTRFLITLFGITVVLTIGTALHLDGHRLAPFPWAVPARWAILENVLPARFAMYASLIAAVIVALWITSTRGTLFARPYVLPALAVATLIPAVWHVYFRQQPARWPFFTDGLYKCIPRNETLAVFPFARWGDAMLWQAESGFWFRMPEGNMGPSNLPQNWVADPIVSELQFKFVIPNVRPSMRQLLGFAHRHRVDRFASVEYNAYPDGTQMHSFGALQLLGGVLVSPACSYTSLAGDRNLVPPGQADLGGRAALTTLDAVQHDLSRAHALLGRRRSPAAAAALLARAAPMLQLLLSYNRTATTLDNAVKLVAHAQHDLAIARPSQRPRAVRSASRSIAKATLAVAAYTAAINPGVDTG